MIFMCGETLFDLDSLFLGLVPSTTSTPDLRYRGHMSAAWSSSQIMEYRTRQRLGNNHVNVNLLHLLDEFRPSFATHSKDHVYSVLGMVQGDELTVLCNAGYSIEYGRETTCVETIIRTATAICMVLRNLDILSVTYLVDQLKTAATIGNFPSWAPVWSSRLVDMPEGPEESCSLLDEHMAALNLCRRAYNFAQSKNKDNESADASKLRQSLIEVFGPGRKLVWTQCGLLALVPTKTQIGDKIMLYKGSKLPFDRDKAR
ncbi:hypothetical protein BKA67DRAFT_531166 [Truncatella angustata]|uniref:Uncharacterized protein n=1 Tax=Truncatella angustata TaxID=152316 RepID=A0A9P8UZ85_9PEZI|nr:uncharacterized protein BKA67DRAFT_531166 [Truncatella angustata]KAH6661092.1 hypothetical protein BKA67DRAFT_531166 [Truncatella angustata]